MTYNFTPKQLQDITDNFGQTFADALPVRLHGYAQQWRLSQFIFIEYYSVNCLFICRSELHGNCVLKIFGGEFKWYIGEIRALREFGGNCGYVRAFECDEKNGALLLEQIVPGTVLKAEPPNIRLSVFADVFKHAHTVPNNAALYLSYLATVRQAAEIQSEDCRFPDLRRVSRRMEEECKYLYDKYSERLLLHGDLHGDNLLKNACGGYVIVDPHARI
ncbi:aminoglycoside phosphotransferase family protein [Stenoxybacter acetivorans]|uniref:aminoglycoside phosphotransferase family protein n=1 Tax=Stenoxybacter acetivorans TaxID=422441 RepID=UPI00055B5284|nr:aminoglycoside phosphotransferase family protein [Stenoxybacter acetivorans]